METKFSLALFCICLYVIILLIVGLLSIIYSKKHKPFKKINDEYIKEVNNFDQDVIKKLKPIKIKFETPKDEFVYFADEVLCSKKDKKKTKNNYDDYELDIIKKNYKLLSIKKPENYEKQIMYVSNKRIVFEKEDNYEIIKFENILSSDFMVLSFEKEYCKGFVVRTELESYFVITSNLLPNKIIKSFS